MKLDKVKVFKEYGKDVEKFISSENLIIKSIASDEKGFYVLYCDKEELDKLKKTK